MSKDPLRRKLFSTPPKNDEATPSRSTCQIRPKAEVTPVKLDVTPSFRRLVENSPVPLAVAAATAAMRAAKSAQNGQPIITEMTRAAEEVVKNSEYNSIRPPHPPHYLSSPRFSAARAAQSASASLPPLPSPKRQSASHMTAQQSMFVSHHVPSSSTAPPINNAARAVSSHYGVNRQTVKLPVLHSPSRANEKRAAPTSHYLSNSSPSNFDKLGRTQPPAARQHTFLRTKPSPIRRLFNPVSSSKRPVDDAVESPVVSLGSLEDGNDEIETSPKMAESIEKRTKKRPRSQLKEECLAVEIDAPENKENIYTKMQTRSLKKPKPKSEPNPMVPRDSKSKKPKKRRRMSEVLRLQKSLESAAWTNSLEVEKQTEVIEILDDSPSRPGHEAIKPQSKALREREVVQKEAHRGTTKVEKKSKAKKYVRGIPDPLKLKSSRKTNQALTAKNHGRPKGTESKRKRNFTKNANSKRTGHSKEISSSSYQRSIQKKRTRKEIKKKRLDHLREAVFSEEGQETIKDTLENSDNISATTSTASVAESPVSLKKRLALEEREFNSASRPGVVDTPLSSSDVRHAKSSRKTRLPKRLNPPATEGPSPVPTPKGTSGNKKTAKRDEG